MAPAEPSLLSVQTSTVDGAHVLTVVGELDIVTLATLSPHIESAYASDARSILIDLTGVSFIDSSGLGLLVRASLRERDSGRLSITASPAVLQLLELTGLHEALPVVSDIRQSENMRHPGAPTGRTSIQ